MPDRYSTFRIRPGLREAARCLSLLLLCVLGAGGCATTPPVYAGPPIPPQKDLVLQAGDVVAVKFVYWPELDEEQAVRPDGKISLALVGDVEAEGLAPEEFRTKLLSLYADKLVDPEINVVVRSLESNRVFVGGEVKTPGSVPIQGRMTALQAVMEAGGFLKESAKMSSVVVVRQQGGRQVATALDLTKTLEEQQSDPYYLQPYDVVYVPRTAIDQVDQFVEQYINKIVPRNLHYTFSQVVENGNDDAQNEAINLQPRITVGP